MNSYDSYRYDTQIFGTGTRWEYEDTIKETLSRVDLLAPHYDACGLPMISDGRVAYVNNTDAHGLIMGSTGSKKTRLFGMPMMEMFARAGESVICTDPKGELYEKTSGLYKQEGYQIRVINLRDPLRSHGWNPLTDALKYYKAGNKERAVRLLNDLTNCMITEKVGTKADPFWTYTSRAMFLAFVFLLIEGNEMFTRDQISLNSLPTLLEHITGGTDSEDGLTNTLIDSLPEGSLARTNKATATGGTTGTYGNILVSYNAEVQYLFSQPALTHMLSKTELMFEELGQKKTILYLIMPDEKTTLHRLVSLIIKQCYENLIDLAQRSPNKTLPIRVNFMLDEFSNLPAIPDMCAMISAARSRNIRFYLIIQGLQQLESKYGPDDAATIKGNCTDWVFLTSRELKLLRELSELCGVNAATKQPLISVSQLQRLRKDQGEALILGGRLYPYIAHLADIDDYPFASLPAEPLPNLNFRAGKAPDLESIAKKHIPRRNPYFDCFE